MSDYYKYQRSSSASSYIVLILNLLRITHPHLTPADAMPTHSPKIQKRSGSPSLHSTSALQDFLISHQHWLQFIPELCSETYSQTFSLVPLPTELQQLPMHCCPAMTDFMALSDSLPSASPVSKKQNIDQIYGSWLGITKHQIVRKTRSKTSNRIFPSLSSSVHSVRSSKRRLRSNSHSLTTSFESKTS
mmetsp:Transcript_3820/g.5741  ORF Transcript_3820/g.5741 Transcript_3820/m.5741 type:complete len:189 (-) Transcript_3820:17-583(-)